MKKGYLIFIFVIFLYAQETLWVRIFDQGAKEAAGDLCFDNQGNILITGGVWRSRETKWDILFVKYTPNGEIIWTKYYDSGQGEIASCIEFDREGNIVIGGGSQNDTIECQFLVAKFSSEGNLIWRRDYRAGDLSSFCDLFIDENNNILLCGDTYTYTGIQVGALFKYDANGNLLWKRFYNWAYSFYKMVPLSDGSFLTLGDVFDWVAYGFRILVVKFNPDGVPIWIKRYEGKRDFSYWAGGLSLDSLGNIIVGGYELGRRNNYDNYDILLIKFTPNGDTLWSKRLDFTYYECIKNIKIDKFGNIYAVGVIGKIDTCDYLLIKFTPDGETIWTARYDNNNKNDQIGDLIIDSENNPIVTGTSFTYDYRDYDCLTIKYRGSTGISENFKELIFSDILPGNVEHIEIYDISGKLIKKANGHKISVKGIKRGIYFIKIFTTQREYIKKLIKIY